MSVTRWKRVGRLKFKFSQMKSATSCSITSIFGSRDCFLPVPNKIACMVNIALHCTTLLKTSFTLCDPTFTTIHLCPCGAHVQRRCVSRFLHLHYRPLNISSFPAQVITFFLFDDAKIVYVLSRVPFSSP